MRLKAQQETVEAQLRVEAERARSEAEFTAEVEPDLVVQRNRRRRSERRVRREQERRGETVTEMPPTFEEVQERFEETGSTGFDLDQSEVLKGFRAIDAGIIPVTPEGGVESRGVEPPSRVRVVDPDVVVPGPVVTRGGSVIAGTIAFAALLSFGLAIRKG